MTPRLPGLPTNVGDDDEGDVVTGEPDVVKNEIPLKLRKVMQTDPGVLHGAHYVLYELIPYESTERGYVLSVGKTNEDLGYKEGVEYWHLPQEFIEVSQTAKSVEFRRVAMAKWDVVTPWLGGPDSPQKSISPEWKAFHEPRAGLLSRDERRRHIYRVDFSGTPSKPNVDWHIYAPSAPAQGIIIVPSTGRTFTRSALSTMFGPAVAGSAAGAWYRTGEP